MQPAAGADDDQMAQICQKVSVLVKNDPINSIFEVVSDLSIPNLYKDRYGGRSGGNAIEASRNWTNYTKCSSRKVFLPLQRYGIDDILLHFLRSLAPVDPRMYCSLTLLIVFPTSA